MSDSLISIIMPVYNGERYIKECIDSILMQTYANFELVIIDDGSKDSTYEIVSAYRDSRIKAVKQDNRGIAISLNKGIALANGDLICRQDADDISLPLRLEEQIRFFRQNPEVSMVGTFAYLIDDKGDIIRKLSFPVSDPDIKSAISKDNPFIHGTVMMKKTCLENCGMYREQFLLSQDYDLWLRISEKFKLANIPEFHYKYRIWENAVSSEKAALSRLFCDIALELSEHRRDSGCDLLMSGNNYGFYMKYGRKIVDAFERKLAHKYST